MEGLKRAQRFRLEDQRGTEINAELPDFLKDNGRSKLRKVKPSSPSVANVSNELLLSTEFNNKPIRKAPQPAPRLSINKALSTQSQNTENDNDQSQCDENANTVIAKDSRAISNHNSTIYANERSPIESIQSNEILDSSKGSSIAYSGTPPPLPPKPKIKPSNWGSTGRNGSIERNKGVQSKKQVNGLNVSSISGIDNKIPGPRSIYLDQPNSSFV